MSACHPREERKNPITSQSDGLYYYHYTFNICVEASWLTCYELLTFSPGRPGGPGSP